MIVITPNLDEISITEWFLCKYNQPQIEEIELLLENHIWVTANKTKIPVKEMTVQHIKNCINCWEEKGKKKIPANYLGGKDKWLKIFNNELNSRN